MSTQGPNPPRLPSERPGPEGGKRDRNRRERTQTILAAGLERFVEEGIANVTIDAIARQAGVAKGSFYRYFADKEQLVAALVQEPEEALREAFSACEEALDAASQDPGQLFGAYDALAQRLAGLVAAQAAFVRLYLQEARAPAVGARVPLSMFAAWVVQRATELTERAMALGLLKPTHPQVNALIVVGAVESLLQAYLNERLVADPGDAVRDLLTVMLEGIRPWPD